MDLGGGILPPPTLPPDGFASRPFRAPGRQIRKECFPDGKPRPYRQSRYVRKDVRVCPLTLPSETINKPRPAEASLRGAFGIRRMNRRTAA